MRVQLSAAARAERIAAISYLRARSPAAAAKLNARIRIAFASLGNLAERGRLSVVPGARELIVPGAPYVIVYEISGGLVSIIRIRHASQDPSP